MKKHFYSFIFLSLYMISMFSINNIDNNKVIISSKNYLKSNEEAIIIDNTKSSYTDTINGNRCYVNGNDKALYYITTCQQRNKTDAKCNYTKKDGTSSTGTVLRNKLKLDTSICTINNNYTDTINGNRCYVNGNDKALYYITTCQQGKDAKCNYTKKDGVNSTGTVLRNNLRSNTSVCTINNNYTDTINGNRCYVNGNDKALYYITTCQQGKNAKCNYTKKDGINSTGTVLRNNLKKDNYYCNNRSEVNDGNIIGATGFSATNGKKYLRKQANNDSKKIETLKSDVPFKILESVNNDTWWKVEYNGNIGYVENAYCMINLPDYIPSIKYDLMNAKNNIYTASGVKLSIYGEQLYKTGKIYNNRLEKDEYIAPVVYSFAKKILEAQRLANEEGYGLKIYDAYRPKSVADKTRDSLSELYYNNKTARNGMDYSYENGKRVEWGQGWFIAQSLSSHSVGAAIDVVLIDKNTGKELPAQSSISDLSTASVKYNTPISGQTTIRNDLYSTKANQHTKDLDRIMLSTGMTNLASEWWHFQDNDAYRRIKNIEPNGLNFQPTYIVSSK